jgi:hypothetical protein
MNGFTIRMQNTTATSLTGFVNTNWTTVYSGTYSVPGTGWQFINLQNLFYWNGQNLMIEICFDNTSYTAATNVLSSSVSSMTWEQHDDNSTGCTFSAGATGTRPNLCMQINLGPPVGITNGNNSIPKVFTLEQNYPNPFNPSTSIKFSLPKASVVKLVIYDLLGKEIRTLVNEMRQPGTYSEMFDASSLASGVYFYRITAGDFTDVKKIVLIK